MSDLFAFIQEYEIWFILLQWVLMTLFLAVNIWSCRDYQKKRIELSKMYWKIQYFLPDSVVGSILKNMVSKKFDDLED